ncbi:hypothetical protein [Nocardioides sp.]|uniref:hypothetical protein n=1 Tax=Nocardioides sp. TaxID=35761 RepID=UPI001A25E6D2|nr:hypothetical protein [Nocardioides sp.]MBJ7357517.1 hypothetical protein [Nocardioides sp.]
MEKRTWAVMAVLGLVFVGMLALSSVAADTGKGDGAGRSSQSPAPVEPVGTPTTPAPTPTDPSDPVEPVEPPPAEQATLPGGRTKIFGDRRFLVAYYGSANTGALGVLGERSPDRMVKRLREAAAPFERPDSEVQIVFELIVTVADAQPGKDRDFNHDIARADVQRYIDAAHRHGALLLLDIQPGREHFLTVARRWKWALEDPYVGLALDPEWRMGRRGVPGQKIGSVSATEVNRVSDWLRKLVRIEDLPQKLFVLHQFRTDMIEDIGDVEPRTGLVMVQHVDGFGTPAQKRNTFHTVVRPRQFFLGFKLFYDEDRRLMKPGDVRRLRPRVQFVSYQ